jgi:hypothetical protein
MTVKCGPGRISNGKRVFRHLDEYVWSAVRLQGKAEGEKTSLRKCIRPLVEGKAPGQDELRAGLSSLVGRLLQTNTSSRFPGTPL